MLIYISAKSTVNSDGQREAAAVAQSVTCYREGGKTKGKQARMAKARHSEDVQRELATRK